ncbi:alpha-L-fucosidase [Actinomadura hibisca]|uniref:alpha-L-fucosidase n=1 Tax=Actinomadura hibisca TaxID=68565 RepID=UPI000B0ECFE5|nr:alpha-L-fucosidase [Actinomadura hibisca]
MTVRRRSGRRRGTAAATAGVMAATLAAVPLGAPAAGAAPARRGPAPGQVTVPLAFDNDGIASDAAPKDGSLADGWNYAADDMPAKGRVTLGGVAYDWPGQATGAKNNLVANGQTIDIPDGRYLEAGLLAAATWGETTGPVTVTYTDGSTSRVQLTVPDWASQGGVIVARNRFAPDGGKSAFGGGVFARPVAFDQRRVATSITLPPAPAGKARAHVFALSLQPLGQGVVPRVRAARAGTRMLKPGVQAADVTVQNVGDAWVTPARPLTVTVTGPGVTTRQAAVITALPPGEEARVQVGIAPTGGVANVTGTVTVTLDGQAADTLAVPMTVGVGDYTADNASLNRHEAPQWFNDQKFGVFIVWGPYSVPAWGPVPSYAEWYWNAMNRKDSPTYKHHRDTYGTAKSYDSFVNEIGAKFNPRDWLGLVRDSGAKYYVFTSKFHDGWAMYDSAVTGRDTVDQGPRRDFVKELVDTNRAEFPEIKSGLYYSLLEWYHKGYSDDPAQPSNPYTGEKLPYTGAPEVASFPRDHMIPQMTEITQKYRPDIVWCDGGWNKPTDWWQTSGWLARWFNEAKARGQEVTVDDRCVTHGDYTTPEYSKPPNTIVRKWEASHGIGHSYGYNQNEKPADYQSSDQLVDDLVDIVSKNGNLLLDIGPAGDGTVPQVMRDRLTDIGAWLRVNGPAIYGTTYWNRGGAEDGDVRFTVKQNEALYATSLTDPGPQLTLTAPVPVKAGTTIQMLGSTKALTYRQEGGKLIIDVPEEVRRTGKYAWSFKISL